MASNSDSKDDELEAESEVAAAASSYELKCPICLEDYDNKAFVNVCFHAFCYVCIIQWSEVSNKCPMCKASFKSLIYDVKTESNYKTHIINPSSKRQDSREVSINEARRFRYRTTVLPGERQPLESQRHRLQQSRKPATEERRRTVYQSGMRALPFSTEGKKVRIRNISASFFKSNPAAIHRLLPWLSRDIKATLGEEHVEFMIQLILSIIDKINIDSDEFIEHLRPFFHHRTEHFVHEFISFAKSPLDMTAYDHKVSYGLPSSAQGAKRTGTSSNSGDVNERGEPSQAGPSTSSTAPGEIASASVGGEEKNKREEEGEVEGTQSEDDIHKRILYELATSTWDESPIMTRKPDTPPSNEAQDSDQDFIVISTSPSVSDIEGLMGRDERVQDNRVTCSTGRDREEQQDEVESEGSRVHEKIRRKSSKSSTKNKSRKHKRSYLSDSGSFSEKREERRRRKRRSRSRERTNSSSLAPEYHHKDSKRTYDKERKHRSSTHHKQRKSDWSSRDDSFDHRSHSRYHGYSSRDRSQLSHDHERKRHHKKHSKRGKRSSHGKEKQSQKRSHDRSHDRKKADMLSDHSTSDDDCVVLSDDEISRELEDINNDLLKMKKRLLKHCLHRERTTLLKSALQKELGGVDTPLATPNIKDEDGSSSIDELEDELMRIERDIETNRNEVAAVNERLEKDCEK